MSFLHIYRKIWTNMKTYYSVIYFLAWLICAPWAVVCSINIFIAYWRRLQPLCLLPTAWEGCLCPAAAAAVRSSAQCCCDLCSLPGVNRLGEQQTPRVNSADASSSRLKTGSQILCRLASDSSPPWILMEGRLPRPLRRGQRKIPSRCNKNCMF